MLRESCTDRLQVLHTHLGHLCIAQQLFLQKAHRLKQKHLPSVSFYVYAILCELAKGHGGDDKYFDAIYDTDKLFNKLQEEETMLQKGKEFQLIRNMLQCFRESSLNSFDLSSL